MDNIIFNCNLYTNGVDKISWAGSFFFIYLQSYMNIVNNIYTSIILNLDNVSIHDPIPFYSHLDQYKSMQIGRGNEWLGALLNNDLFFSADYRLKEKDSFQVVYDDVKDVPTNYSDDNQFISTPIPTHQSENEDTNESEISVKNVDSIVEKITDSVAPDEANQDLTLINIQEKKWDIDVISEDKSLKSANEINVNKKQKTKRKKAKKKYNMFLLNETSELTPFNLWLLNQKCLPDGNIPNIITLSKKERKKKKKAILTGSIQASIQKNDRLVSESLAKILAVQGHYSESIEMYKQLILNIPEKSAYFASQIEELKNNLI